ncbi:helix-turn-helix transcriptional regulator [Amycolatopsis sp. lyj-346]|uniref:helix-turn-helix transcriptional regulator n=1 Tax=Amycolatopsis sp. lyj-346 TaxID=2789289 RepID=UPI00397B5CE7
MKPLVERTGQLRALDRLLAAVLAGKGQVALVDGPVASGRTTLLRAFAEHAEDAGVVVLESTGSHAERMLPWGVLNQFGHGTSFPAGLLEDLPPSLADGDTGSGAPEPGVVRVFDRLASAVLDLAARSPVVLGVDDVQHADALSVRWLLHLVRRVGSARIFVVLTDDATVTTTHPPFRAELSRHAHFRRLSVGPLSGSGVGELLSAHFGETEARGLTPELLAASGGNPVLVHALLEDHRAGGAVRRRGYGVAFVSCLHRGGPDLTQVARAIAVLGDGSSPGDLGRLIGVDAETVGGLLHAMTAAGLLTGCGFRHPVARAAVLDDLGAQRRVALHRRAAGQLYERGRPAAEIAPHLVQAGEATEPWAGGVLLEAAGQAVLRDRHRAAVDLFALAHRSSADDAGRAAILSRLAHSGWQVNPAAAVRHLAPLVVAAREDRLGHRDRLVLVKQLLWHGRVDDAVEVLGLVRAAAADDPGRAAELRDVEQWLTCVHPPLARRRRPPARQSAHQDTLLPAKSDPVLNAVAELSGLLTHGRTGDATARAEQLLRDGDLVRTASWGDEATLLALLVLLGADLPGPAMLWCDRLRTSAARREAVTRQAILTAAQAEIALRQGSLADAADHARAAMALVDPTAWGVALGLPLGSLVTAATRMGDHDDAAKHLTHPVDDAMFTSRYGLHYLLARGHHHLATGKRHAALADFLSCGETMRAWGVNMSELIPWQASAAEAWLSLGNQDQARRLAYEQLAEPDVGRHARGLSLRVLAATTPVEQRPRLLTEALDLFEACGARYEQARALVDLSCAHHEAGDGRRGRMVFRRAWHLAETCGARPLTQRLLSISADVGDPSTGPDPGRHRAVLTGSEERVALLAAMGCTNREIAEKLYVTASTVEQHLTRVYRKLNIKSRKDIPADLSANAPVRPGRG